MLNLLHFTTTTFRLPRCALVSHEIPRWTYFTLPQYCFTCHPCAGIARCTILSLLHFTILKFHLPAALWYSTGYPVELMHFTTIRFHLPTVLCITWVARWTYRTLPEWIFTWKTSSGIERDTKLSLLHCTRIKLHLPTVPWYSTEFHVELIALNDTKFHVPTVHWYNTGYLVILIALYYDSVSLANRALHGLPRWTYCTLPQ